MVQTGGGPAHGQEQVVGRELQEGDQFITPHVRQDSITNVSLFSCDPFIYDPIDYINRVSVSKQAFIHDFNCYKIGAWNANGWISITQSENINFKENVLKTMDLDI